MISFPHFVDTAALHRCASVFFYKGERVFRASNTEMMATIGSNDGSTTDGGPEGQITPQGGAHPPPAWLQGYGTAEGQLPTEAADDGAADDAGAPTDGGAALGLLFARDKPWASSSAALSIPGGRAGTVLVMSLGKSQGMVDVQSMRSDTVLGQYTVVVNVDLSPTGSAAQQDSESGRVFPFMTRWVQVEAVTVSPNPAKADKGDRSAFTGAWEAEGKVSFRQVVTSNDPAIAPSLEEVTRSVPVERFLRGLRLDLLASHDGGRSRGQRGGCHTGP